MTPPLHRVVLKSYCEGFPTEDNFSIEETPCPELKEGEFLVRHIWASIDPGTRSRLSQKDSYASAQGLGETVNAMNVGVIEASRNSDYPIGLKLSCAGGWASHSVQNGRGFLGVLPEGIDMPLSYWIGILGIPGLTAWFGLNETGAFKQGDRVLVTSAAGQVGATAGQIAKAQGAAQIVGIAGTDQKCAWLTEDAGFDAAINYKSAPDLDAAISDAFPKGIDLFFDNVGNQMIDRVLPKLRPKGRIVVSGQIADYNVPVEQRYGIKNTDVFITHRLTMQGLVVFDYIRQFPQAITELINLMTHGKLIVKEERVDGIEAIPAAFCGLFHGENFGRCVARLSDDI